MLFLSLTVSDEFNVERAAVLWGYHKTLAKDFGASRHGAAARFAVDRNDPNALSVEFPRFRQWPLDRHVLLHLWYNSGCGRQRSSA